MDLVGDDMDPTGRGGGVIIQAQHESVLTLETRLTVGWQMCEQEPDPRRKHDLEDHWVRLLHEYEQCAAILDAVNGTEVRGL